ncbi:hypothetical protein DYL61_24035 [Pseudomonas nabeulensis]|uniref:DUF3077 domain-containing protein n=1 Tax=Pseudomonas nabeulensis TaxID=2293833 RepID=A0A4Z0AQW1_9PSED|nr:DUF6124 family protein [Pseudomonas nabeulensis]TFY88539.1 hypothetical protein DYL61_24035 [Pseudomonas nabeulensis]
MIKDSPNPPLDSTAFHTAAHRAINHYPNPSEKPEPSAEGHGLFAVREGLDAETLLANASEDLASVQALASHLAFEVDGSPRSVALGISRMLEGIQLLVDKALTLKQP